MSELVPYGFECGNPKCKIGIVMGDMLKRPQRAGDLVTFVTVKPGKLKCPKCGWEQEYTQADLREFERN
jgi:hypothetical protein